MHVFPSKYVFKVKNGKPKVRLVALGCRQIEGIDYTETYAPVVSLSTIRKIFAMAAALDLEREQMDVVTAFLNGDLKEGILWLSQKEFGTMATRTKFADFSNHFMH